jgi:curved DNA-binding protein
MRVRGRGLPKGKTGERGDFFVILNVVLPTILNDEERAAWEKLRATSTFRPRLAHEAPTPATP